MTDLLNASVSPVLPLCQMTPDPPVAHTLGLIDGALRTLGPFCLADEQVFALEKEISQPYYHRFVLVNPRPTYLMAWFEVATGGTIFTWTVARKSRNGPTTGFGTTPMLSKKKFACCSPPVFWSSTKAPAPYCASLGPKGCSCGSSPLPLLPSAWPSTFCDNPASRFICRCSPRTLVYYSMLCNSRINLLLSMLV